MSRVESQVRRKVELGGFGYVLAMLALAAVAAWPIYASLSYLVLIAAAVAVGTLVALLRRSGRIGPLATALTLVAAYLVLGLTLAMPLWTWGPLAALQGVGAGPITSWQNLLTVDLPVAGYRNLLIPALLVFLLGSFGGLTLAWRERKFALAVPVLLLTGLFGLLFGSDAAGVGRQIAGVRLAPELAAGLGLGAFIASLAWLAWRAAARRTAALGRGTVSGPGAAGELDALSAAGERRLIWPSLRRLAAFVTVLAVASVAALALAPLLMRNQREVLRSGRTPDLRVVEATSPLAQFRRFFDSELYDTDLFTVTANGPMPERARLAVLTDYDGEFFSAGTLSDPTQFRRVPWTLTPQPGPATQVQITGQHLDEFSDLWLPIAGSPERIEFAGLRPTELRDGFYYDRASEAAINTAPGGTREGDVVVVDGTAAQGVDASTLDSPNNPPHLPAPEALEEWLENNGEPHTGAGLVATIEKLRERGYLSHSVDDENQPWVAALAADGYQFAASAAGHSLGRIDSMFRDLNEREGVVGAHTAADLVGTAGNDEQFATAAALIADQYGFPVRVVIGAHLSADGDTRIDPEIPTCVDGQCTGASMSAWIEVQGANGQWAAIDVRPQHRNPVTEQADNTRLPQNPTDVRPDTAEEASPPDALRGGGSAESQSTVNDSRLAWLWPVLRAVGIGLLVVLAILGPPGTIVGAKWWRRRGRRKRAEARDRIVAGWDELVDKVADQRNVTAPWQTRSELATALGSAPALALARESDRAAFSNNVITDGEAQQYWTALTAELRRIGESLSPWQRLRAEISLSSLLRRRPA